MGSYREQYERYYGNVRKQGGAAQYRRANSSYEPSNFQKLDKRNNFADRLVRKFIWQLSGAAILLATAAAITYIPAEGSEQQLNYEIKTMINEDIDITAAIMYLDIPEGEVFKEKVLDYIDEVKSVVSGKKTLKELIKEDYIEPVSGKVKYINGDSKGVAISSTDENVAAVYGGTVEEVRDEDDNKCIVINHGNGTETYYGSLSKVDVEVGSIIEKGDVIGKCGAIDSTDKKGMIFKFIYLGSEKDPSDIMNLSSLEEA